MSDFNSDDNRPPSEKYVPGQSVKMWNETVARQKAALDKPIEQIEVNPKDLLGEILGRALVIGRNKKSVNADIIAALDLAERTTLNLIEIELKYCDVEADCD